MISGAGMLDFLVCQSAEKLVVDAEAIAMAQRLLAGMQVRTDTLATELFEGIDFKGDFLKQKETRRLFRLEQFLPSAIIDRNSVRGWQQEGSLDSFGRAKERVQSLLKSYERPAMPSEMEQELRKLVEGLAREAGMEKLPEML